VEFTNFKKQTSNMNKKQLLENMDNALKLDLLGTTDVKKLAEDYELENPYVNYTGKKDIFYLEDMLQMATQ
jgi:hypothetical protein